jgi:putative resolvase
MEKMYRIREAAELLGISKRHLQRLDKQGKITCIRTMGGHRRIREEEIKKILGEVRRYY